MKSKCPVCKKPITFARDKDSSKPTWLPFCSRQCKLIDLGRWLDSEYRIPVEPDPEDEDADGNDK